MDKDDWAIILFASFILGVFLFAVSFLVLDVKYEIKAIDASCNPFNMEYTKIAGGEYCIDNNNKVHLAIIECEGWIWKRTCKARLIEVEER